VSRQVELVTRSERLSWAVVAVSAVLGALLPLPVLLDEPRFWAAIPLLLVALAGVWRRRQDEHAIEVRRAIELTMKNHTALLARRAALDRAAQR